LDHLGKQPGKICDRDLRASWLGRREGCTSHLLQKVQPSTTVQGTGLEELSLMLQEQRCSLSVMAGVRILAKAGLPPAPPDPALSL
jgi:hypothetical protein